MKNFDIIDALVDNEDRMDWATFTGRSIPRREMNRAVKMGLAVSVGLCLMCDSDGFHLDPERYREGFQATPLGRKWLKAAKENALANGYPRYDDQQLLALAQAQA